MQLSDANPQTNKSNFNHFSEKGRICDQIETFSGVHNVSGSWQQGQKNVFLQPQGVDGQMQPGLKSPKSKQDITQTLDFYVFKTATGSKVTLARQ